MSERLLESQWATVRAYQAVDEQVAAALFEEEIEEQQAKARSSLEPLQIWPDLPAKGAKAFKSGPDLARLRKILELVRPGDRVLEIGTGRGYMTGVLLRERSPRHYCGVDINPKLIDSVLQMAEVNGFDMAGHHTQVLDLFDLTPEFLAEHDPDCVLLLEVVEHVADPAAALRTVAAALGDDTMLVFSVPLLGRIEACWGHVSLFDDVRIRRLCDQAGLLVQNVEVVQNHWVLVVAARSMLPPERFAGLAPRSSDDSADEVDYSLRRLPVRPDGRCAVAWRGTPPARTVTIDGAKVGVTVHVEHGHGGVVLATPNASLVRIEIAFENSRGIDGVEVEQSDESGSTLARWHWAATASDLHSRPITYVFRPGVRTRKFEPVGDCAEGIVATTAIHLHTGKRGRVSMTLRRAAAAGAAGVLPGALRVRAVTAKLRPERSRTSG